MRAHYQIIVAIFIALTGGGCKPTTASKLSEHNSQQANDFKSVCKSDPAHCTAEAMIRERFGALPCSQLWVNGGENVYAFDRYSSQYHRRQQVISATHEVKMGTIGRFMADGTVPQETSIRLESSLRELLGAEKYKLAWESLPIGVERTANAGIAFVFPKFYALRVQNDILGRNDEWTIFRASVPPGLSTSGPILGQATTADLIRDEVASFCVPVRTHFESGAPSADQPRLSLRKVIETLNEADDLKEEVRNWDQLYNSMATFVEAAPLTGQVSTVYRGCYLKDRSCARALLMVTGDVATYYVLAPAKYTSMLGRTTYIAVTAIGATANVVEGGLLARDSYDAARSGNSLQSVLLGGSALLRFSSAAGMILSQVAVAPTRGENVVSADAIKLGVNDFEKNAISKAYVESSDLGAMKFYQGNGYKLINGYLRGGEAGVPVEEIANVQKHADALIALAEKQSPIGQVTTVYRGSSVVESMLPAPGSVFEAKGMLSTSFNVSVAKNFSAMDRGSNLMPMIVEIEIPASARGIAMNSLGGLSRYPYESELLFANGSQFKVVSSSRSILNGVQVTNQKWVLVSDGLGAARSSISRSVVDNIQMFEAYSKFFSFFDDDFKKVLP